MHPATIPLAALATFAAVYLLTPAPAVVARAEPAPVEAPPPVAAAVEAPPPPAAVRAPRSNPVPAPPPPAEAPRSRPARPLVEAAASSDGARPELPVRRSTEAQVYFPGCNEVRAAGLAPLFRDQPGYRPDMDGDGDGIACEPHRRGSAAGARFE
jgi:hypothetical protein